MKKAITIAAVTLLAIIAGALSYLAYVKADERAEARAAALAAEAERARAEEIEQKLKRVTSLKYRLEASNNLIAFLESSIDSNFKLIADAKDYFAMKEEDARMREERGVTLSAESEAMAAETKAGYMRLMEKAKDDIAKAPAEIKRRKAKREELKKELAAAIEELEAIAPEALQE